MKIKSGLLCLSILSVFITALLLYGCDNKDRKKGLNKELTEGTISADSVVIKSAEKRLEEFYKLLQKSDYKTCVEFFKEELFTTVGKESLVKALEQRNSAMGKPDNFKVIYNYIDLFQNKDTVYYFITRVFNDMGGMCYEKFGIENKGKDYVIGRYEYSPAPYVDEKMANDGRSEINKVLNKFYALINSRDYDKLIKLTDHSILEKLGKENLIEMLKVQFKKYLKISDFIVTSVKVEIVSGIIYVEMSIDVEDSEKSVFKESIVLIDRLGTYYVANYKRLTEDDKANSDEVVLTDEQYGKFKKEVGLFYDNLSSNNVEAIMSKCDNSVFQNTDYSLMKDYILTRINKYGTPSNTEKTKHITRSANGFVVVDFYFTVTNSKSVVTYEKVSIAYAQQTDFKILGYEYSEKPIK
jgi:hypothetical protein